MSSTLPIPDTVFNIFHYSNYVRATFKFKEGNVVMVDPVNVGGTSRDPTLTNQLRVGDPVKLVSGERMTVEKATDLENDVIIGTVHAEGKFDGTGPIKDAEYGEYTPRKGTIIINAKALKSFKVVEGNKEIAVGDLIKIADTEYNPHTHDIDSLVDKGTNDNETFALNAIPAGTSDGYVDVLFEFKPLNGSA